jgi:hypothetical protein
MRPCKSWPRPGTKKLHRAAMTLPAEPCPLLMAIPESGEGKMRSAAAQFNVSKVRPALLG